MLADLALMTVQIQLVPVGDVLVYAGPHEFTGDCCKSGFFSQVGETMDSIKHLLRHGAGTKGLECPRAVSHSSLMPPMSTSRNTMPVSTLSL